MNQKVVDFCFFRHVSINSEENSSKLLFYILSNNIRLIKIQFYHRIKNECIFFWFNDILIDCFKFGTKKLNQNLNFNSWQAQWTPTAFYRNPLGSWASQRMEVSLFSCFRIYDRWGRRQFPKPSLKTYRHCLSRRNVPNRQILPFEPYVTQQKQRFRRR